MKTKARIASRRLRFRAFLTDIFLIYAPILYAFYFVLGSEEAFLASVLMPLFCTLFFGLVQTIFLSLKAQSPRLRAYDLYLIDKKTGKKASLLRIFLRYLIFIISFGLFFGLFVSLLRKDRLGLHDVLTQTCIVSKG